MLAPLQVALTKAFSEQFDKIAAREDTKVSGGRWVSGEEWIVEGRGGEGRRYLLSSVRWR